MKRRIFIFLNSIFIISAIAMAKSDDKTSEIEIKLSSKGNDIAFDIKSFQVPFGKNLVLKFANRAKKDSEIIHNIAILKQGTKDEVLKYFEDNDYDLAKVKKHASVLAMTRSLEPGESQDLTIEASKLPKPGYYPYICLIPGHADMLGMEGLMHVKK